MKLNYNEMEEVNIFKYVGVIMVTGEKARKKKRLGYVGFMYLERLCGRC